MKKLSHDELVRAIYNEWGNLHHNASMSGYFPDFQNEYESHLCMTMIGEDALCFVRELSEAVEEKFGYKLTFCSYGRGGATIAPNEWMGPAPCNNFGPLKSGLLEGFGGLEAYNNDYRILMTLRFINQYMREALEGLKDWWERTKEANDYQPQIDEHEGMTLRYRTVEEWVAA
jgi:hypothetical protein